MVSLCGLALSSVFLINNKATVHADTVNDSNQQSAISWDSDSDDSQVVKTSQTKAEQAVPQKVNNDQQSIIGSAQNNVENERANQTSTANLVSHVDATPVSASQVQSVPIIITNPQNNQVIVHYVNMNGHDITDPAVKDSKIDMSKATSGNYVLPSGWHTLNGNTQYQVDTNISKTQGPLGYAISFVNDNNKLDLTKVPVVRLSQQAANELNDMGFRLGTVSNYGNQGYSVGIKRGDPSEGPEFYHYLFNTRSSNGSMDDYDGDEANFSFDLQSGSTDTKGNRNEDWGVAFTPQNYEGLPNIDIRNTPALYKELKGYYTKYGAQFGAITDNMNYPILRLGLYRNHSEIDKINYVFSDKSDDIKAFDGNTINLAVIKPQNVDPASDMRCQASATRIIQLNFAGGIIPESYKNIVDSTGKLVQTVHFTRTATEDALTGNILQYGSWISDNQDRSFLGFPVRTLPKIPGYTLSIKPA